MTGWYDFSNIKSSKMLSFHVVAEAHGLIYPRPSGGGGGISVLLLSHSDVLDTLFLAISAHILFLRHISEFFNIPEAQHNIAKHQTISPKHSHISRRLVGLHFTPNQHISDERGRRPSIHVHPPFIGRIANF